MWVRRDWVRAELSLDAGGTTFGEGFYFGKSRHAYVAGEGGEEGAVGPA
jgi:hypothetical protein